jgi:thiol:disulfide interchange protein DsbC
MKSVTKLLQYCVIAAGLCAGTVSAGPTFAQGQLEKIKQQLRQQLNINVSRISPSPVHGFYEVFSERGLLYVSTDGKQLIHGKVYDIDGSVTDLTEEAYSGVRQQALAEHDESALVYPAKDEKYQVSVFTDITCGYCRKMHSEIKQFNDLGITVKYYAYPRGGLNSKSSRDLDVIWCDKDPEAAMTAAKSSGRVNGQSCATSPVTNHYQMGASFGVSSTPALVFEDGSLMPGYKPPAQLLALLQSKGKN